MPGFDHKFADIIKRRFVCPLCSLPMKDPVQITMCGHRFCDTCLQAYLSEGVFKCPEDHLPLDYAKIYPDPEAEANIMSLIIKCIHHKDGCKWTDELKKLQGHLNTCKFDTMPCTNNCAAMIPRILMNDHLQFTCPKRRTKCDYCNKEFSGEMLEGHAGSCQFEPIFCENKCGTKLQRRFVPNHLLNECQKRLVPCRYCHKDFVCDTLQTHMTKCPQFPVICPNRCDSIKIPREELETHLLKMCPSTLASCTFYDMGCRFKGPRYLMEKHLEENQKVHLSLVYDVVLQQQQQIGFLKSALTNLAINTEGVLLWKISNYSVKLTEAKLQDGHEFCSPPFYTSQYGYKLQASAFLNGNGAGEGSYLSLYIKVLAGDYDALLSWPFCHPISFTLYDQGFTADKCCHITERFLPDVHCKNFQRPNKDGDCLGFGYPRFVSHETLRKRNYLKEDTLFIKVKVDCSNIILP